MPRTVCQLLGLPPLGVPRTDSDPGLADLVDATSTPAAPPPAYGQALDTPAPPNPAPAPRPLPPWPVGAAVPVPAVVLRTGGTLPPPDDVKLPQQPAPPPRSG